MIVKFYVLGVRVCLILLTIMGNKMEHVAGGKLSKSRVNFTLFSTL